VYRSTAIRCGSLAAIVVLVLASPPPLHAHDPAETPPEAEAETPPEEESSGFVFLPNRPLFEPLTGDPRWPRFSASYLDFEDDPELETVGSVAMGGSIPFFQAPLFFGGRWEVGVQAGIFSIFDLDSSSSDLVNTDFWVGLPLSARWGLLSLTVRPHHQSSHLGDEYLLRGGTDRIDISFEAVDGILSVDLWSWGRIYGGGGYLVDRDPESLERKYVQTGVELNGPLWFGVFRAIAAGDFQRREASEWRTDYSARAGIQFENSRLGRRRIQLLAEYYKGRNPNGQFFDRELEYFGVGLHAHF
jgi:hypothetical protein